MCVLFLSYFQLDKYMSRDVNHLCLDVMHLSILGPTTPHTGHRWGLVGIIRDLHVNFDPRGGAFDQFAVKKYWSGLGSLWENQKEAEWLPSLEEGKN